MDIATYQKKSAALLSKPSDRELYQMQAMAQRAIASGRAGGRRVDYQLTLNQINRELQRRNLPLRTGAARRKPAHPKKKTTLDQESRRRSRDAKGQRRNRRTGQFR